MPKPVLAEHPTLDSFWRSLWYFSIYRLSVALLFFIASMVLGKDISLGTQDFQFFQRVTALYLLLAVGLLFAVSRQSKHFNFQLSLHVIIDVVALTLMMFASGGQKSGIAMLLLVVVSGAGLVGQGRMVLFYAAVASVAVLLEESWRAITIEAGVTEFVRAGVTSMAFFSAAIIARLLARRVVANEVLARERGRQLDEQLRISQRIIRDMEDGVLVVDGSGEIRLSNPQAQALLGHLADAGVQFLPEFLAERYPTWLEQNVETAEILQNVPENRQLRVRYLPAAEVGGNSLIYLDDMERVHFQAQQIKLAALGRLTANLAHEIRNPLSAISHAAELLGEEEPDPLRQRLAGIVYENTGRLNQLVTDVLELGRRDRAILERIVWQDFISGLLEELALHDASATSRVQLAKSGDLALRFDPGHLHRILWNLLDNALRYANSAANAVRIEIREVNQTHVELHVIDNGPGVEAALRGQVFEPFFTTRGAGTGLGLYIARELCEANGAHLDLLHGNSGANFCVTVQRG